MILEIVRRWRTQDWTTLLMWGWKVSSESKITPRFLAVDVTFVARGPRRFLMEMMEFGGLNSMISDLELFRWRKFWAIQQFTSLRQSDIEARLLGSSGLRGRYICVSSA